MNGVVPTAFAATVMTTDRATVRRDIRRQENSQTSVSSLTGRTAGDLRLVRDEYRYNRLSREERTALLNEIADALEKLADPKAAERIENMPWVTTRLATARQALRGHAPETTEHQSTNQPINGVDSLIGSLSSVAAVRRSLLSASGGQAEILAELERLKRKTRREFSAESIARALSPILEKQQELLEKTQELGEETLGKNRDELSPEEAAEADSLAEEQKGLRQDLNDALEELRGEAEEMKEADPARAEAIEEVAEDIERQAVGDMMQDAGQEIEDNQLAGAQEKQQEILDALQGAQEELTGELGGEYENPMAELEEALAEMEGLAERQEELLGEAEGLPPDSTELDYNDLQVDEGNLQADLQEVVEGLPQQLPEQGQQPQQAMQQADQAMEQAEQALGEQDKGEAAQGMEEALRSLMEARAQMAMQLAQMRQQMGMRAQQTRQQRNQRQRETPKLPVRRTEEYDPTTGKTLYGKEKVGGKQGWNVGLEPGEREVLVNAARERFPRRYEREIMMYYRNLAGGGSGAEK